MRVVTAKLLTETGRPNKLLIPPSTTKMCPVGLTAHPVYIQEMRFELYIAPELAIRSLFLIQTCPLEDIIDFKPLIYNGGWESQWIEHGQEIVNIYEFRV
jgi:hypothetical protein